MSGEMDAEELARKVLLSEAGSFEDAHVLASALLAPRLCCHSEDPTEAEHELTQALERLKRAEALLRRIEEQTHPNHMTVWIEAVHSSARSYFSPSQPIGLQEDAPK